MCIRDSFTAADGCRALHRISQPTWTAPLRQYGRKIFPLHGRHLPRVQSCATPVSYTHLDVYKRQKLGDAGRYICTVRKVGYKLTDEEAEEE